MRDSVKWYLLGAAVSGWFLGWASMLLAIAAGFALSELIYDRTDPYEPDAPMRRLARGLSGLWIFAPAALFSGAIARLFYWSVGGPWLR